MCEYSEGMTKKKTIISNLSFDMVIICNKGLMKKKYHFFNSFFDRNNFTINFIYELRCLLICHNHVIIILYISLQPSPMYILIALHTSPKWSPMHKR